MAAGAVKSSSPAAGAPAAGTAARAAGGSTAQKPPQQVTQTARPDPAPQTGDPEPQAAGSARRSPGDFFKQLLRPLVLLIQAPAALLERVLPKDTSEAMPNRTMAFVALIVPVVVVSVAVLVYIRRGVESQSQVVLDEAVELALKAQSETDILAKRSAWIDLVDYLDAAELLYAFPESQELRDLAQGSLDDIDLVRRIEYQPAVYGGLPSSVNVVRMVTADDDLYMLDGNSGNVYHAALTEQGYVLDGTFLCGPGTLGVENRLIDIMAWPVGFEPMASLVAIDAQGNVVYCQPGQEPLISEFASPPTSSLSGLTGFTMDQSNLFLLDPQANSVWIYWGSETDSPPDPFFADQIPRLDDVVDLMIANNELYLLHQDGQLTICEYSSLEIAPTSCKEPVPFVDSRQARENMIITPTSPFSQILYNPPPDPSLFVLQPDSRSINLFSLRTPTYQTQYQPIAQLEGNEATAFAVDPIDRLMYLALGNHVYYGRIP